MCAASKDVDTINEYSQYTVKFYYYNHLKIRPLHY